ncbi:MAG: lipoyl(octanoyl) transferase LipB, partial [Alphaproteobacteria bacterium]|nr:lipoyl(octanoyl) transferase LipB [Alphaproteobacteria bacterium]
MKSNIDIKNSSQIIEYSDALNFMEKKVDKILCNEENEMLWFLNHNHIYTCGTSAKKNEILSKTDIPILQTNRGGKTTYHGPGQRVVYFMINLNKRKKDIRKFINIIENSVISLLKEFDIEATTFP